MLERLQAQGAMLQEIVLAPLTLEPLSQLIAEQGISPIRDLDELAALWPADDDPDALMNFVLTERQARLQLDADDQASK